MPGKKEVDEKVKKFHSEYKNNPYFKYHVSFSENISASDAKAMGYDKEQIKLFNNAVSYGSSLKGDSKTLSEDIADELEKAGLGTGEVKTENGTSLIEAIPQEKKKKKQKSLIP